MDGVVELGEGVGLAIGIEARGGPGSGMIGEGSGAEGMIEQFEDGGGQSGGFGWGDQEAAIVGEEGLGAGHVGGDARGAGDQGGLEGGRTGGGGRGVDVQGDHPPEGGFEGRRRGEGEASGQFEPMGSASQARLAGSEAADEELDIATGLDDAEDGVEEGFEPRGRAEATDRADDRKPTGGERIVLGPGADRGVDSRGNDLEKSFREEGPFDHSLTHAVVGNDHGGQVGKMQAERGIGSGVVLDRPNQGHGASGGEPGGGVGNLVVQGVDEGEPGFGIVDQESSDGDPGEPGAIEPGVFEDGDAEFSEFGRAPGTDHQRGDASVGEAIDEL